MALLNKIDRHADLVQRMAQSRGADLGDALLDGAVSAGDLRGAVLRCMLCENPDDCAAHLDAAEATGTRPDVPGYCRNHDLMDRIARG